MAVFFIGDHPFDISGSQQGTLTDLHPAGDPQGMADQDPFYFSEDMHWLLEGFQVRGIVLFEHPGAQF